MVVSGILFGVMQQLKKEGNVLFNDTHTIHYTYGYMASNIW